VALSTAPEWRLKHLPALACPHCGYELTQNPLPICPECGYHLTDGDISLAANRVMFLEFTKWSAIKRHTFCFILMLLFIPYVGAFVALPPILSVLCLPNLRLKGVEGKIRRRVWLMSSAWLHIPWVVCGLAPEVYDWMTYRWFFLYSLNAPDQLYDFPEEMLFMGTISMFAVGFWMWRRSLKALATRATLSKNDPLNKWRSWATRVALISYGFACLIMMIPLMLWTLDTFWPGWA